MVTAFGEGTSVLRAAIEAGQTGIRPVQRFDTSAFDSDLAALVPGTDTPPMLPGASERAQELMVQFAVAAGREALLHANWAGAEVALVLGTNIEDRERTYEDLLDQVATELDLRGARLMTSIACASAASALGTAARMIERGDASIVLAGGSDVITPWVMAGFSVVGVLKPGPCTPFGAAFGLSLGEGAGLLVLEHPAHAAARGAVVRGLICGAGLAADGFHLTRPDPDGRGLAAAAQRAGAGPYGYVNAHGTGTEANDAAEVRGVVRAVGEVPMSSGKGLFGHAQGAAAAIEVISTLLCMERGRVPPTWGTTDLRAGAPAEPLLGPSRDLPIERWLKVSAAFGGANAALAFGPATPTLGAGPVYLGAVEAVGPHGVGLQGLAGGYQRGGEVDLGLAEQQCRRSDLSREDPTGVLVVSTATRLLRAAGLRMQRNNRRMVGVIVGQARTSHTTVERMHQEIEDDGPGGVRAGTFARASMVAAAGLVTRELGLHGPCNVLSCGALSGLVALVEAAEHLRSNDLTAMLALCATETGPWTGAGGVLLQREPTAVQVVGWAIGGGSHEAHTIERSGAAEHLMRIVPDASGAAGLWGFAQAQNLCEQHGSVVVVGSSLGISAAITLRRAR